MGVARSLTAPSGIRSACSLIATERWSTPPKVAFTGAKAVSPAIAHNVAFTGAKATSQQLHIRGKSMDKVRDWMSQPPICAPETMTLPEARRLMHKSRIRRLPVLDSAGRLTGIVTEGDINRISASRAHDVREYNLYYRAADLPLRNFMTRPVITVGPDEPIIAVAQLLLHHRIGGVPVVEGDRVVGVITESSLFRRMVERETAAE